LPISGLGRVCKTNQILAKANLRRVLRFSHTHHAVYGLTQFLINATHFLTIHTTIPFRSRPDLHLKVLKHVGRESLPDVRHSIISAFVFESPASIFSLTSFVESAIMIGSSQVPEPEPEVYFLTACSYVKTSCSEVICIRAREIEWVSKKHTNKGLRSLL